METHVVVGKYAGFDKNEPTSESGGKSKVIDHLRKKFGFSSIVMIGDGITDLEVFPSHAVGAYSH